MRAFYFGCVGEAGHYFWTPDLEMHAYGTERIVPWGFGIDDATRHLGSSCRRQGEAALLHKNGWSVLVVADYSVDKRPASLSAFLFERPDLTESEAWRLAAEHFGPIVARVRRGAAA